MNTKNRVRSAALVLEVAGGVVSILFTDFEYLECLFEIENWDFSELLEIEIFIDWVLRNIKWLIKSI